MPQDVYQTAKVAKVLLLLESGKGKDFFGKSLDDIDIDTYCPEEEERAIRESSLNPEKVFQIPKDTEQITKFQENSASSSKKLISRRVRWSNAERKLVLHYFKTHIERKVTPKKHECDDFLKKYGEDLIDKDWVKIKTFVYNSARLSK